MSNSEPSYVLFAKYITRDAITGEVDASQVISKACYDEWLQSRKVFPRLPEESFRKALTSHCRGVAGMKPFSPEAEAAVLELLRRKELWPCFAGSSVNIGVRGCHLQGYWEEQALNQKLDSVTENSLDSSGNELIFNKSGSQKGSLHTHQIGVKDSEEREKSKSALEPLENIDLKSIKLPADLREKSMFKSSSRKLVKKRRKRLLRKIDNEEVEDMLLDYEDADPESPDCCLNDIDYTYDCSKKKATSTMKKEHSSSFSLVSVASNATNLPYCMSRIYLHNEELYGRKTFSEFLAPETSRLGNLYDAEEPQRKNSDACSTSSDMINKEAIFETDIITCMNSWNNLNKNYSQEELSKIMDEFCVAVARGGIVEDTVKAIFRFLPKHYLLMFVMHLYKQTGFSLLFPDKSLLDVVPESMGIFFKKDFVLPKSIDCLFMPDRPKGICLGDFATYTIIDTDQICRDIYRGNVGGLASISTRVHKAQGSLFLKEMLSILHETGEVWTRSIEYRCDGTIMVLLNRYSITAEKSNRSVLVEHQDITEQFVDFL